MLFLIWRQNPWDDRRPFRKEFDLVGELNPGVRSLQYETKNPHLHVGLGGSASFEAQFLKAANVVCANLPDGLRPEKVHERS
jgi:hypothetical protein